MEIQPIIKDGVKYYSINQICGILDVSPKCISIGRKKYDCGLETFYNANSSRWKYFFTEDQANCFIDIFNQNFKLNKFKNQKNAALVLECFKIWHKKINDNKKDLKNTEVLTEIDKSLKDKDFMDKFTNVLLYLSGNNKTQLSK